MLLLALPLPAAPLPLILGCMGLAAGAPTRLQLPSGVLRKQHAALMPCSRTAAACPPAQPLGPSAGPLVHGSLLQGTERWCPVSALTCSGSITARSSACHSQSDFSLAAQRPLLCVRGPAHPPGGPRQHPDVACVCKPSVSQGSVEGAGGAAHLSRHVRLHVRVCG